MTETLEALETLMASEHYNRLPMRLAEEKSEGSDNRWWQIHEVMVENEAKLQIWEAAQWISLLFDTYGDLVESVSLNLDLTRDRDEVHPNTSLYINDEICHEDKASLDDDTIDAMDELDDRRVFHKVVDKLNNIASSHLLQEMSRLQAAFGDTIRSSSQARQVGMEHAGEVQARLEALALEQGTPGVARAARGPGRL